MTESMVAFQIMRRAEIALNPRDVATACPTGGIRSHGNTSHLNFGVSLLDPGSVYRNRFSRKRAIKRKESEDSMRKRLGLGVRYSVGDPEGRDD